MQSSNDLCIYRMQTAIEKLETAKLCIDNKHFKDAVKDFLAEKYEIEI